MFNVRFDFGFAGKLFGVPRSWLSKVGAFCSSFSTRGNLLSITLPDNPDPANAPVVIEVNESALASFVEEKSPSPSDDTPAADSDNGSPGSSTDYSRADHSHPKSTLYAEASHTHTASDVTDLGNAATKNVGTAAGTVAAGDHNHNGVYQPIGNYAAASHTHTASQVTDLGNAATKNVGTGANNVAAGNHTHSDMVKTSDLRTQLGSDGKVLTSNDVCAAGDIVPCNDGHAAAPPNHRHYHTYIVNSVATTAVKVLGWVANSAANTAASLISVFSPDTSKTGVVYNSQGTISYKSIGTGSGDVAAGNHNHDGVYQPAGSYAALTDTAPSTPRIYKNAAGTVQSSSAGTATTAARADHIHLLPDDLLDTYTNNQYITGSKRFRNNKLSVCADTNGTSAAMWFNNADATSTLGGIISTPSQLQLRSYSSGNFALALALGSDRLYLTGDTGNSVSNGGIQFLKGAIELFANIPYIDFHFGNSTNDYTSRIWEPASGVLTLASPNHARLSVQPITDTTDGSYNALQIATVKTVADASTPTAPSSTTSIAPTSDTANTTSWTAGGANGLSIKKLVRTKYVTSGNTPVLYGFYRTETYDKYGRLYSVSAETRETIDSTFLVNWS